MLPTCPCIVALASALATGPRSLDIPRLTVEENIRSVLELPRRISCRRQLEQLEEFSSSSATVPGTGSVGR